MKNAATADADLLLTPSQIQTYLDDGVLVVPLLSAAELHEARCGLIDTLKEEYGVDVADLEKTGRGLMAASSTNGAGKRKLAMNCRFIAFFASLKYSLLSFDNMNII
jgi:hypothetical protein